MGTLNKFLDSCRKLVRHVMHQIAKSLNAMTGGKLHPNTVTVIGLLGHVFIVWLIIHNYLLLAGFWLIIFGLFDTLDGELARLQKRTSTEGMLLDSISDRIKEILLYTSFGYAIIGSTGRPYLAVWAIAACGSSLLVSYVNAWGEAVNAKSSNHKINQTFRGGLFPFEVRMFVLLIGLLSGRLTLAVIVITIGASWTALSRLARMLKTTGSSDVQT